MIDIENEVFTQLAAALRGAFKGVYVTSESVRAPPAFPCVCVTEQDNASYTRTRTQDMREKHAVIMFQIDVYSNKTTGKKSECKTLCAVVDDEMQDMGFTRQFLNPVTNPADNSVYRMTGRYMAVVSNDHTVYRR